MRILAAAFAIALAVAPASARAEEPWRAVHVFVALCDNATQGIVPVPPRIGNGDDPKENLYWGAIYGLKNHFKLSKRWKLVQTAKNPAPGILERCVFAHAEANVVVVADAYQGSKIKATVRDFLAAAAGWHPQEIKIERPGASPIEAMISGGADLDAYIGHDGLMDFELEEYPGKAEDDKRKRETIILACFSQKYFGPPIMFAGADPLLWTTHLMAPEAYTLHDALEGWIKGETKEEIRERAAQAYHKHQDCDIKGARRLFATGWPKPTEERSAKNEETKAKREKKG